MIDSAEILVKAGDGGAGRISFRREKCMPYGGPDGGDGGDGGDVTLRADASVTTLLAFRYKRHYRADNGGPGEDNQKHGKNGKDICITVPEGTVVRERTPERDVPIVDLEHAGQEVVVVRGGRGGRGNLRYASSTNQTPYVAQVGEKGGEKTLLLELRLIADVGIVGYPNAGKSTLLCQATSATPKVADYPFTTLEPALGVVEVDDNRFVMAEIPGLIAGAHQGKGLGYDFLRHATRTKVIIHLVDGSSAAPVDDMIAVNNELTLFDTSLGQKPQIVAVNKIDMPDVRARIESIAAEFAAAGVRPRFISAACGDGVRELMAVADGLLRSLSPRVVKPPEEPVKVFRPAPADRSGAAVRKEGDIYIIEAPELERLVTLKGEKYRTELPRQLRREINRRGIKRLLERAGIQPGDKIRCGPNEMEW